jgi:hypothetical protein
MMAQEGAKHLRAATAVGVAAPVVMGVWGHVQLFIFQFFSGN